MEPTVQVMLRLKDGCIPMDIHGKIITRIDGLEVPKHPLLTKMLHGERQPPARWLHIKLQATDDETTLAVRGDNVRVLGFRNQNRVWFKLGDAQIRSDTTILPPEYNSVLLNIRNKERVVSALNSGKLGKSFTTAAVRVLSRFPEHMANGVDTRMSARYPLRDAFPAGWSNGTGFTKKLMDYMENWGRMSGVLLEWMDRSYQGWTRDRELKRIGIKKPRDALRVVHLVPMKHRLPPVQPVARCWEWWRTNNSSHRLLNASSSSNSGSRKKVEQGVDPRFFYLKRCFKNHFTDLLVELGHWRPCSTSRRWLRHASTAPLPPPAFIRTDGSAASRPRRQLRISSLAPRALTDALW
uniref:rRNA N-glycosylase n=1 Tax=Setaria viridis TaxID=4556 RepID=A0A4U6TBI4_SETVI|nr:hypothetical protein SEVIR_8G041500v2 [Setaria viridis]